MNRLKEGDHLFDGFAHRPFDPNFDGWMNELPDPEDFPSVRMAEDILRLYERVARLTRENWDLKQRLARWEKR